MSGWRQDLTFGAYFNSIRRTESPLGLFCLDMEGRFTGIINHRGLTGEHLDSIKLSGFADKFRTAICAALAEEGASVEARSGNIQGILGAAISVLDTGLLFSTWVIDDKPVSTLWVGDGAEGAAWLLTKDGALLCRDSSGKVVKADDSDWIRVAPDFPDIVERRIELADRRIYPLPDSSLSAAEYVARKAHIAALSRQKSESAAVAKR